MATDASFKSRVDEVLGMSSTLLEPALLGGAMYGEVFFEESTTTDLQTKISSGAVSRPQFHHINQVKGGLGLTALDAAHQYSVSRDGWEPSDYASLAKDLGDRFRRERSFAKTGNFANRSLSLVSLSSMPEDGPERVSLKEKKHLLVTIAESLFSFDPTIKQCVLEYRDLGRKTLLVNSDAQAFVRE